jgi:hypothetical protein
MGAGGESGKREIYVEFTVLGAQVKVTAIDGDNGVEVSIFGPSSTPRRELEKTVVAKLDYVLKKRGGG